MKNLTITQAKLTMMRKLQGGLTALVILIVVNIFAQTPQAFKFQAVVRDADGHIISEQLVSVKSSILQNNPSGTVVYSETQTPTTNEFGLISINIGTGSVVSGDFTTIDWGGDVYFLQIELDDEGGSNYQLMGTSQILSVPYSLYSTSSGELRLPYYGETTTTETVFNTFNSGTGSGIRGENLISMNFGILGNPNYGVYGENNNGNHGYFGGNNYGAYGFGDFGVLGEHNIINGPWGYLGGAQYAVYGEGWLGNTIGYLGGVDYGVYGFSSLGHAGYFEGKGYFSDNLGIGTLSPDASALLEINSNSKGFLPPRMTTTERDAISTPADGLVIFNTTTNCLEFYAAGYWHQTCGSPDVPTVVNPSTSEIWMDRNLGASQIATSSTDATAYGDLYQWGRLSDGHEDRSSSTTITLSSTDNPGHSNFILATSLPYDWRSPQNNDLWQGVNGTNNPCPSGFRIPTETEWEAERLSWVSNDADGAFGSPLKLTVSGYRHGSFGHLGEVGISGFYWSSTVSGVDARLLNFDSTSAYMYFSIRAGGFSVRCIKD